MFKREVKSINDILQQFLRKEGLETPLQQKRLIDGGSLHTGEVYKKSDFVR